MFPARRLPRISHATAALLVAAQMLSLAGCGGSGSGSALTNVSASAVSNASPTAPGWSAFTYPTSGQLGVEAAHAFSWTAVPGSQGYQLQVGTSFGASDVFDSGVITTTSVQVTGLPATGVLYARVRAIPNGWGTALSGNFPRGTYVTFRADTNVTGAAFTYPAAGATTDADLPIAWQNDAVARGYRLTIGSSSGASDLHDSGTIFTPLRVVPGLPAGATVYATLSTYYTGDVTRTHTLSFVVGNASTTTAGMLNVARTLGAQVRGLADTDNQPLDGTLLALAAANEGDAVADCQAFAATLLAELGYANVQLQSRELGVCFNINSYDCHALVEALDTDTGRWVTIDPTFGLYALNAQGQPATSAEISAAARSMSFTQLSFTYLTAAGAQYAHAYYIDYPLLFLNVYAPGTSSPVESPPASLEPYFDLMGPAVDGAVSNYYAAQCASGYTSATSVWDGTNQTYGCTNGFTPIFWAISVSVLAGDPSTAAIWRTHRFIF